ncbi:hypothetical protein PsorP6_007104 [Peronosclerospora sorghi]|uniref:Uncharacterized protein n=1 Tax=Peronosclerospora sorghi TaxID=230839 RepID=A0ACC0W999_9STRA|nr:hypothetical protein PsorP6_007104 [Peronosclerospora sorghi]
MSLSLQAVTIIFLTLSSSWIPSHSSSDVIKLYPEVSLSSLRLPYGVPHFFRVMDLKPTAVYDIKVSYPATQPSIFTLQVERMVLSPLSTANDLSNMPPRRRRLNTAKVRLHPSKAVESRELKRYRLEPTQGSVQVDFSLLAEVEGVQRPGSKWKMDECVFDIVVEEVLFGICPRHTLVLLAWLMVLLIVSGKWVLPYLEKKIALACKEDRVESVEMKES